MCRSAHAAARRRSRQQQTGAAGRLARGKLAQDVEDARGALVGAAPLEAQAVAHDRFQLLQDRAAQATGARGGEAIRIERADLKAEKDGLDW